MPIPFPSKLPTRPAERLYNLAFNAGSTAGPADTETTVWLRSLCTTGPSQNSGFMDALAVTKPEATRQDVPWGAVAVTCARVALS
jgi:hypothetical protein